MTNYCEPSNCGTCDDPQLARNTYFDGKPMLARDFADEQNYLLGKHQRHNRYLHGWGTACGLEVVEHPNPACQDRYVVVKPGVAIDCCGREILLQSAAMVDLREAILAAWRAKNGANSEPDSAQHRVSLALRYIECPAEPVPAVFEGCGSGEPSCLPGKLVDGYEFYALLDRAVPASMAGPRRLLWDSTNNIDQSQNVAYDPATKRMFVLTQSSPATLFEIDAETQSIQGSRSFADHQGLDLAVARGGNRVFVSLRPNAGGDAVIHVLDAANIAAAPTHSHSVAGAGNGPVRLLALSDDRLAAISAANKKLLVWASDINGTGAVANPAIKDLDNTPVALAQGSIAGYFYIASGDVAEIVAVPLATLTPKKLAVGTDGLARPSAIAVAARGGRDLVAVVDGTSKTVLLFGVTPEAVAPELPLSALGSPISGLSADPAMLAFSHGGSWLYAGSRSSTGEAKLHVVSVHRRATSVEPSIGAPIDLPPGTTQINAQAADELYVPFLGDPVTDDPRIPGGVAVFEISGEACASLFDKVLGDCPACEDQDDIVLATIANYRWSDPFVDAVIDNRIDRRLLPSTSLIAEVVNCLAEQECCGEGEGAAGDKGPPGAKGLPGAKGIPLVIWGCPAI